MTHATWPDIANTVLTEFKGPLTWIITLFLLWIVIKISERSLKATIVDILHEFTGDDPAKRLNAFGGLILFAVILFLYSTGLAHIVAPRSTNQLSDYARGIDAFIVFVLAIYFAICNIATR
jgi:hypothetical protein